MLARSGFKINLGLQVTERREDGFHNLETVFYPVDLVQDTIEIEPANDVYFSMTGGDFATDPEKNLCVRAYRLLQDLYDLPGCRIQLDKKIPSGAGLGGGSSNAATVLKMTNEFFKLNISNQLLKKMAAKLGSDVPFFIDSVPAYATGRGEILRPISVDLSGLCISVFKPLFSVSTAEAYARVRPCAGRPPLPELLKKPVEEWKSLITNDFEEALAADFPELAAIKAQFYELGATYAALSGSGSAVFALAPSPIRLAQHFNGIDL